MVQIFSSELFFSNILSIYTALDVRDQVAHPYKTKSKTIVLYILIFTLSDRRRDDKKLNSGSNINKTSEGYPVNNLEKKIK
jgi:hypothetical protein